MVLPRAKAAMKGGNDTTAATARTELRRDNAGPSPRFHRGIVSDRAVDTVVIGSGRTELRSPGHVVGPEHHGDAYPVGRHMTQSFAANRRSSSRVTSALVLLSAVMLASAAFPGAAGAQVFGQPLGYASTDDAMTAPPATDESVVPERLRRTVVAFNSTEAPGTVIIDTGNTALYYVLGQGRAIRYGVGVGREGFTWSGVQTISRKAEWPDWHPPAEMIARQPYLPRFMAGGPGNPLGARAMYLGTSQYRIHGTNDPSTIGKFVSSGCIRLTNEDVSDLFSRVDVGTKVVVLPKNVPVLARGPDTRTTISVRPVASQPRATVTTLPSGRQALNVSTSSLY
jgi:lipoprotein-anchoring transpeptidase ErfK/SrfK